MVNVKKHLRIPFELKKWTGTDDTLASMYDPPVGYRCYVEDSIIKIEDKKGKETISMRTFYIGPDVPLDDKDLIVYKGKEHSIKKLTDILSKKGKLELWIAYV